MAKIFVCKTARIEDLGHGFIKSKDCPLAEEVLKYFLSKAENAPWVDNFARGQSWCSLRKKIIQTSFNSGERTGYEMVLLIGSDLESDSVLKEDLQTKLATLSEKIVEPKNWLVDSTKFFVESSVMNDWQELDGIDKIIEFYEREDETNDHSWSRISMKFLGIVFGIVSIMAGINFVFKGNHEVLAPQKPVIQPKSVKEPHYNPFSRCSPENAKELQEFFSFSKGEAKEPNKIKYKRAKEFLNNFRDWYLAIEKLRNECRKVDKRDRDIFPLYLTILWPYTDDHDVQDIDSTDLSEKLIPFSNDDAGLIRFFKGIMQHQDYSLHAWLNKASNKEKSHGEKEKAAKLSEIAGKLLKCKSLEEFSRHFHQSKEVILSRMNAEFKAFWGAIADLEGSSRLQCLETYDILKKEPRLLPRLLELAISYSDDFSDEPGGSDEN